MADPVISSTLSPHRWRWQPPLCALGVMLCLTLGAAEPTMAQSQTPTAPPIPDIGQMQTKAPVAPAQTAEIPSPMLPVQNDPVSNTDTADIVRPASPGVSQPEHENTSPAEPEVSWSAPYFEALRDVLPEEYHAQTHVVQSASERSSRVVRDGGPSIWAITALSIVTVAIILWKIWRLALIGAWTKGSARAAVAAYESRRFDEAYSIVTRRRGVRSVVVRAAIAARQDKPDDLAREETVRVAKHQLAEAATGLRALELIATIAPLLGLLGTVLGMISAFQALQQSGSGADPALLAGGIWEALLTTAAGMAVAIPASMALSWFESVIDRMRRDIEDTVTRIFVADPVDRPVEMPRHGMLAAAAE